MGLVAREEFYFTLRRVFSVVVTHRSFLFDGGLTLVAG